MRTRSMLLYAVRDMMRKDKWAERYNPDQRFNVNQYDYETVAEYLDALREEWKDEVDPFEICDGYVDVSKYKNFEKYEEAAQEYLDRLEWKKYEPDYDKYDVNPLDYDTKEQYLDALYQKVREEYDPYDDFPGLDPSAFDYPFEYDYAIEERWGWKIDHDPEDKYDVDPGAYEYEDDYVEAIKKWKHYIARLDAKSSSYVKKRHQTIKQSSRKSQSFTQYQSFRTEDVTQEETVTEESKQSWGDKHNSFNTFGSVDPNSYDHEKDYLDDLRKQWKEYYDPSDMYDVDPFDYDNEEDYMEAIKEYIKSKYR
ncbi:hypothetical protein [uncultured Catenibacterium sp.]|uniref:hypothetical protein n=1 Tax=uncultured Catenibacterium sp. TaxID=286142 RepID=UPI0025EDB31A|nr:hypothetical protein [uncultured Catenibacterium sp.]